MFVFFLFINILTTAPAIEDAMPVVIVGGNLTLTQIQVLNVTDYNETDPKAYNGTLAYNDTLGAYDSMSGNSYNITYDEKVSFPGFTDLSTDYGFTDNSVDWDDAYSWGDYRDNQSIRANNSNNLNGQPSTSFWNNTKTFIETNNATVNTAISTCIQNNTGGNVTILNISNRVYVTLACFNPPTCTSNITWNGTNRIDYG
jgi:hypothetical protein